MVIVCYCWLEYCPVCKAQDWDSGIVLTFILSYVHQNS